jgi:hypothetical protein
MVMHARTIVLASAAVAFGFGATASLIGQQAPAAQGQGAPGAAAQAGETRTPPTFFPPPYIGWELPGPAVTVPEGFTPIFNGRNLSGWHISRTSHHGRTPDFFVQHGLIMGTQQPLGGGGILLTDRSYRNFELYMEVKPDWGNDSGIFLRSTESGAAYQVTMDFLPNGSMGAVIGEGGMQLAGRAGGAGRQGGQARQGGAPAQGQARQGGAAGQARQGGAPATPPPGFGEGNQATAAWVKAWKRDDWNAIRVRMVGEVPRITVWINDQQITDFQDTANSAIGGITEGPIAIQVHGAGRWQPGGYWRWRNIGIKELP